MTLETEEIRSPERYLQLAATAEECARNWRRQAEELIRAAKPAEPILDKKPPQATESVMARRKNGPYRAPDLDKAVALCKRQSGATADELMDAAGWEKRPYPSTVGMLATRRGMKFWMTGSAGAKRYHMS